MVETVDTGFTNVAMFGSSEYGYFALVAEVIETELAE